jgi:hypothetical protein
MNLITTTERILFSRPIDETGLLIRNFPEVESDTTVNYAPGPLDQDIGPIFFGAPVSDWAPTFRYLKQTLTEFFWTHASRAEHFKVMSREPHWASKTIPVEILEALIPYCESEEEEDALMGVILQLGFNIQLSTLVIVHEVFPGVALGIIQGLKTKLKQKLS